MKRVGYLYDLLYSKELLNDAFKGVMKGKKKKLDPTSRAFMLCMNAEYYKNKVAEMLYNETYKPTKPIESYRRDKGSGKIRKIQAPRIFPDQIVHWAMIIATEKIFMKGMDPMCCSSVKGRGSSHAMDYINKKLDNSNNKNIPYKFRPEVRYKYCLKADIKKFFESIDRDILMQKLASKIKDKKFLNLCEKVIKSVPGTGLPLGYYTSQWFSNFYLESFDHYLREVLMPKYGCHVYVRYADYIVILGSNKRKMHKLMNEMNEYLIRELKLRLKENSCVFPIASRDIDFIGYRFSYGKMTMRKRNIHHAKTANNKIYRGKRTLYKLRSNGAYNGMFMASDTKRYREKYLGDWNYERSLLIKAEREEFRKFIESDKFKQLINIVETIQKIREDDISDKNTKGSVLIRYYPNTGEARIVDRTTFYHPSVLQVRQEIQEKKNKSG